MLISLNLKSSLLSNLEPEPVEDLYAGDDGEASEEAHHAAHPGDLVRQRHLGVPLYLEEETMREVYLDN